MFNFQYKPLRHAAQTAVQFVITWSDLPLVKAAVGLPYLGVISGFSREVHRNCALLGSYAPSSGEFLLTCRDNSSVPFSVVRNPKGSKDSWPLKMRPTGCAETSVKIAAARCVITQASTVLFWRVFISFLLVFYSLHTLCSQVTPALFSRLKPVTLTLYAPR